MEPDKIFLVLIICIVFLGSFLASWKLRKINLKKFSGEFLITVGYIVCILTFIFVFEFNNVHYSHAIARREMGYSPIGIDHLVTVTVFQILFIISALLLWLSNNKLPPLIKVLTLSFLIIGAFYSIAFIFQISHYSDPNLSINTSPSEETGLLFALLPIYNILLTILLWTKEIKQRKKIVIQAHYNNKVLEKLNQFALKLYLHSIWLIPFTFPVFALVTLLLMLFGQHWDSSIKVFTETTCWRFSQMSHPDYLPHQGHYLCTVAARGNPKIVKPVRFGTRHGQTIIVNRQLLIANAFEEVIQDISPQIHGSIRNLYDKYGLPLSKYINTPMRSNITYMLMKPLELIFLTCLYLICLNPEQKISKQYNS